MPRRYAARTDDNQREIVDAFRKLGWSVWVTSSLGTGGDAVVGKFGRSTVVEIKDGRKPPSARKLTPNEEKFHREWNGSLIIVESVADVIEFNRKHSR